MKEDKGRGGRGMQFVHEYWHRKERKPETLSRSCISGVLLRETLRHT